MKHLSKQALSKKASKELRELGLRIKRARVRRGYSQKKMGDLIFVGRDTIRKMEQGLPTVSIGVYAAALEVFGLVDSLSGVAGDDPVAKQYELEELQKSKVRSRNEYDF